MIYTMYAGRDLYDTAHAILPVSWDLYDTDLVQHPVAFNASLNHYLG